MKHIVLHTLTETDDSLEVGPAIGQIVLTERGPRVQMTSAERREKIERLLAEPLLLRGGDPSGIRLATQVRPVTWQDGDDFVRALLERLEQPDIRLRGRLSE